MHTQVTVLAAYAAVLIPAALAAHMVVPNVTPSVASNSMQMLSYIKRKSCMRRDDFLRHWFEVHAPIGQLTIRLLTACRYCKFFCVLFGLTHWT